MEFEGYSKEDLVKCPYYNKKMNTEDSPFKEKITI